MKSVKGPRKAFKRVFVKEHKSPKASDKVIAVSTKVSIDIALRDLHEKATEAGWLDWNILFTSKPHYIFAKRTK